MFLKKWDLYFHGPIDFREPQPPAALRSLSEQAKILMNLHTTADPSPSVTEYVTIIDINKYSSIRKLHNVTFYVMKFIVKRLKIVMTDDEIFIEVREYWLRRVQHECYPNEFEYLMDPIGAVPPLVCQLNLALDQDLIVCKGRIDRADFPSHIRTPVLLGRDHLYTKLLVQDIHLKVKYLGVENN